MKQKLQEDLERALKNNNNVEKIVKRVFQAGLVDAQFDFKNFKNVTLLMVFVLRNDYAMTERLLKEYNANRLIKKDEKYNALFLATELLLTNEEYNPAILTLLLAQDAKEQIVSQEPTTGHTVVSFCVMHNNPKQTKLFLEFTTDPLFIANTAGDYPIHLACSNIIHSESTQAMLTILLQHQPERQVLLAGRQQELPIHAVLFNSDTKSLPLLLAHAPKEQLTAHRQDGTSVLHIAAVKLQFVTLGQLKKYELIPALVNELCDENTSLFLAIIEDEDQIVPKSQAMIARFVSILLEYGADAMIGKCGMIPLEKCCTEDYADVAKLLLDQKTNEQLSNVDSGGFSPLMTACYFGAINTVKLLLSYPVCQTKEYLLQKSKTLFTALRLAMYRASLRTHDQKLCNEIIALLLQYFPHEQLAITEHLQPLEFTAIQYNCLEILKQLLIYRSDINELLYNGMNLLQFASQMGRFYIEQFLINEKHMIAQIDEQLESPALQEECIPSLAITSAQKKIEKYTWCKNAFANSSNDLVRAHLQNERNPVYLYIPDEIKQACGFSDKYWQEFLQKQIRSNHSALKSLSLDLQFKEKIHFGDRVEDRAYKIELKIGHSDCILLFMVPSDDCKACLLVAGRFLPGGLHNPAQVVDLTLRLRTAADIKIALPRDNPLQKTEEIPSEAPKAMK